MKPFVPPAADLSRRRFVQGIALGGTVAGLGLLLPVFAAMPGTMAMAVAPDRPLPRHAPSPTASPPLRPPAA